MSQAIRKLKEGDKVSQQQAEKVFKDGNRSVSFNLIQKNANQNVQAYLNSKGWGKRKKQAFIDAYSDMLSSIDSGNIKERDSARRYVDSSGRIKNSDNNSFDAYGEAAHFLDTIVDAMPDYEEKVTEKEKYDTNGLFNFFKKKTFGGNDPDLLIWQDRDSVIDEKTGKRGVANRATYFADIIRDYSKSLENSDYDFTDSAYSDKSDLLARLQNAENNLRNGTFNNDDFNSLTALGLDGRTARMLFSEDSVQEKEKVSESEQYLLDAEEKKKQEELDKQAEILRRDEQLKEELTREYLTPAQGFVRRELQLPSVNYNSVSWGKALDAVGKEGQMKFYQELENYLSTKNPFDNQNLNVYNSVLKGNVPYLPHLANNLYALKDKVGVDAGNGYYYLPYTINKENGTILLYNPSTNTIAQEAIHKIPSLWNKIQNDRRAEYTGTTFNFGEGGILKFQSGGYYSTQNLDFVMDDYKRHKAEQEKQQEQEIQDSAKKNNRTVKQEKAGQKIVDEWGGTEWARIGSAAADAASIVAAFVPAYGTALSAGLGVSSTLTNLGADIADESVSAGDAALNALTGLGMDVVGLIPGFGAAGKSSKIAKNLVKLAPKLITYWSASQSFAPAATALSKLMKDEDLTVDDWKALSAGLSSVAGLSRIGAASMKTRAYKNAAKTGDKTIQVKSGEMKRVTPEQLEELKKAKNLKKANEYLKTIKGLENEELAHSFKRGKNPFKSEFYYTPKTGDHFNFDFKKVNGQQFGNTLDEQIYTSMVNSSLGIPMPHFKIPGWISNFKIKNPYTIKKDTPELKRNRIDKAIQKQFDTNKYYEFRKKGGILKAKDGIRNVMGSKDLTWGNNIYGSEGFWKTLDKITKDNLNTYNTMQNTYSTLGFTNSMPGDNLSYNKNVADYQKAFQENTDINNLTMANLVSNGLIKGRGNSSDKSGNWTPDGLAGTQTWLRHLGTKDIGAVQLQGINDRLKTRGVEAFINNDTGMVNFRALTAETPAVETTSTGETNTNANSRSTSDTETDSYASGTQGGSGQGIKWLDAFSAQLPSFIGAGRLAGNIWNNNRVTEETLKGLKPLYLDTYNLQRYITGDLATKQAYYNKAAQLENLAGKPRTSDASLQLAGELDAAMKGNELRTQGDLADNEMIRKTSEQAWQTEADNMARRSDYSNKNRASGLGIDKAKHDVEAARKSANWVSLENFLKELEYKQLTKSEQQKEFGLQLAQDSLWRKYYGTPKYNQLYKKAMADGATQEDREAFQNYDKLLNQQYRDELNKEYARIHGLRLGRTYSPIYVKNGGSIPVAKIKAKTESAKLFQENIKESVKNHLHMIDNLSKVTKELIIKSMTV